jgi:YHS domain-containing protein
MKLTKQITSAVLLGVMLVGSIPAFGADAKEEKPKPYPLETCVVSGEKLGEMGKPFVFTYEGQEVKLCCKNCKKDFDKEPAKYIKKIDEAEKAAKDKADKKAKG